MARPPSITLSFTQYPDGTDGIRLRLIFSKQKFEWNGGGEESTRRCRFGLFGAMARRLLTRRVFSHAVCFSENGSKQGVVVVISK